jgi:hypothetical protein
MGVEPARQTQPHRFARLAAQAVGQQRLDPGHQRGRPGQQPPDRCRLRRPVPQDAALRVEREGVVARSDHGPGAALDLGPEHTPCGSTQDPALGILAARLELVAQPLDPADRVAVDQDLAVVLDRRQRRAVLQALE